MKLRKLMNNFHGVFAGKTELYFSYETLIAFRKDGMLYISENVWGTTTGKHLNFIHTDKTLRMNYELFKEKAKEVF